MDRNKHYIRVQSGNVVKGFSDAFEQPQTGDICISENGGRHFEIDSLLNPSLYINGVYQYRYVGGVVLAKTKAEIDTERAALPTSPPTAEQERDAMLLDIDFRLTLLEFGGAL